MAMREDRDEEERAAWEMQGFQPLPWETADMALDRLLMERELEHEERRSRTRSTEDLRVPGSAVGEWVPASSTEVRRSSEMELDRSQERRVGSTQVVPVPEPGLGLARGAAGGSGALGQGLEGRPEHGQERVSVPREHDHGNGEGRLSHGMADLGSFSHMPGSRDQDRHSGLLGRLGVGLERVPEYRGEVGMDGDTVYGTPSVEPLRPRQLEPYPDGSADTRRGSIERVNPFWSPAAQKLARVRMEPEVAARQLHEGLRGASGDREDPGSQRQRQPEGPSSQHGTPGLVRMRVEEIEGLRRQFLMDAQEKFEIEVARLKQEEEESFKTASSGNGGGVSVAPPPPPPPPPPPVMHHREPSTTGRWVWTNVSQGADAVPPPPPPPMEPKTSTENGKDPGGSLSESLRNLELPKLSPPGTELSAILFGDWLTVVGPLMGDVAPSAREWWRKTMHQVEELYGKWLTATPLQKLRLEPSSDEIVGNFQRIEQRAVSMLLAAIPEVISKELIAARRMSVVAILLRLHTIYQPRWNV